MELEALGYIVHIDPHHGGQVRKLTYLGQPILRTSAGSLDPLETSCFPLIPYSNRIKNAKFLFANRPYQLKRNWQCDEHSIHGEGWLASWSVMELSADRCMISYTGGKNWPWSYRVELSIQISKSGVKFEIEVLNSGHEAFPVGAGFHPYFPRFEDTELKFTATEFLKSDDWSTRGFSTLRDDIKFRHSRRFQNVSIDACFSGWDRRALILQPTLGVAIELETSSETNWCTLYIPESDRFFCFEPVSHATGAFNRSDAMADGLHLLRPDKKFKFDMTLRARTSMT